MALILASKSPRRKQLLELITKDFIVAEAMVDEASFTAGTPGELAVLLAKAKANAVGQNQQGDWIIGCDTVVDVKGKCIGKPKNSAQALEILKELSGTRHFVHTGVCLLQVNGKEIKQESFINTTAVNFGIIDANELDEYVLTDEPYDKAGGYGIQGWAARYIHRIEGCYYNAMGLPVAELFTILKKCKVL